MSEKAPTTMVSRTRTHAFDHSEARRLYEVEHLSFAAIARRLGVSDRSIRECIYKAGLATPNQKLATAAGRKKPESDRALLERFARLTVGEPKVRKDGLCSVCRKPRRPEQSARYAHGCAELDPFCSAGCARKFHGTTLPVYDNHGNRHRGYVNE